MSVSSGLLQHIMFIHQRKFSTLKTRIELILHESNTQETSIQEIFVRRHAQDYESMPKRIKVTGAKGQRPRVKGRVVKNQLHFLGATSTTEYVQ